MTAYAPLAIRLDDPRGPMRLRRGLGPGGRSSPSTRRWTESSPSRSSRAQDRTGLEVRAKFDIESTKTVGLTTR